MRTPPRASPRRLLASGCLLAVSTAVSFGVVEYLTRLVAPQAVYPDQQLFLSSPHFQLDARGAVRYQPHEWVRMVAIYNSSVEFDVSYATNDLGFIDHKDYLESSGGEDTVPYRYAMVAATYLG